MSDERALMIVQPAGAVEAAEGDLPELDDRERAFVDYYLGVAKFNATDAVTMCGITNRGSAQTIGYRLMRRAHVRAHIEYRLEQIGVNRARILAETAEMAFSDWKDHVQITMHNGEVVSVRMDLKSKMDAIKLLGTELGMFSDKLKVDVSVVPMRLIGVDIENDL